VILWYPLAIIILGPIAHTNLALRVPSLLHKIILTPDVHRLHHSLDLKQGNSNYALVFPFWDIVFGTFSDPTKEQLEAVGLCFNPLPRRIIVELAAPFIWPLVAQARREEAKA
jgi:sterol desaturase/sphingolipid hydroxylase (fatty acid hydroxylase superfamily)